MQILTTNNDYIFPNITIFSNLKEVFENSIEYNSFYSLMISRHKKDPVTIQKLYEVNKLFILGEPGYGKSRFLKELVLNACDNNKEGIYLNIKNKEKNSSFAEYIEKKQSTLFHIDASENFLEKTIFTTRGFKLENDTSCLICLDALDEVNGTDFSQYVEELTIFINQFPKCQIIISCRTHHLNKYKNELSFNDFRFLLIHAFNNEQIFNYLRGYYIEDKDIDSIFKMTTVNDNARLLQIPRYLSLIKNRILEKGISEIQSYTKHDLFEYFIYHKLETESKIRDIEIHTVKRILEKIALIMEIQQINSILKDDLLTCFDDIKSNISQTFLQTIKLQDFYDHTILKDNIDSIEFENTEFQEYLAAKEIKRQGRIKQVIFDLAICPDIGDFYPSWFNVLGFLLDMDISLLPSLIQYGSRISIQNEEYFELILKIDNKKIKQLSLQERESIFKIVFGYYQDNAHFIDSFRSYDLSRYLCYYYNNSLIAYIEESIDENKANDEKLMVRRVNVISLIKQLLARNLLFDEEKERWKKSLLEFACSGNSNIIQTAIYALGEYNDLSLIKMVEKCFNTDDKGVLEAFLFVLGNIAPDDNYSLQYFLQGFQYNEFYIEAASCLMKIKSHNAISSFLKYFCENPGFQKFFLEYETIIKERYFVILENIKAILDDEIIKLLEELVLKIIVNNEFEVTYEVNKSSFLEKIFYIIKEHDKGFFKIFLNQLLESKKEIYFETINKTLFYLYDNTRNLIDFVAIAEKKKKIELFYYVMRMFYLKDDKGKKIYEEGRAYFPEEYQEQEKRLHAFIEETQIRNAMIYEEFKNKLGDGKKQFHTDIYCLYSWHKDIIDKFITPEERNRFIYLVELFLKKVNSESATLIFYPPYEIEIIEFESLLVKIIDEEEKNKLKSAYKKDEKNYKMIPELSDSDKKEIKDILKKCGKIFGTFTRHGTLLFKNFETIIQLIRTTDIKINLLEYRKEFIHYIPFLLNNEYEEILDLIGDLSETEMGILLEKYSNKREDDLAEYNPLNLIGLARKFHFIKALPLLKKMINEERISAYQRALALEVIAEFGEEEKYFLDTYARFQNKSGEVENITKKANEILIKRFENEEAVKRTINHIKKHKENIVPQYKTNYIFNALLEVSNPYFIETYFELLDYSFELFQANEESNPYSSYIWDIVTTYFNNLKKYNSYSYLIKLENHVNKKFENAKGINWFKHKLLDLKISHLNYLGKNRSLTECIFKYNKLKEKQYLPITSVFDLYEMLKDIIDKDLKKWIQEERAYAFIEKAEGIQEELIQKTIVTQIENCFLKRGFRQSDIKIHREVQSYDDKRPDFLISYGFIPPVVIEVKRLNNQDITIKEKREKYKEKFLHYLAANHATYGIYLIFKTDKKNSSMKNYDAVKALYKNNENVTIKYLDCIKGI